MMQSWEVLLDNQVAKWLKSLDKESLKRVAAAVGALKMKGPQLGVPLVKPILASTHANMKELRIASDRQQFRILFAFDVQRKAIFLAAGDKSEIGWTKFYDKFIPIADERFTKHQAEVKAEIEKHRNVKAGSPKGKRKGRT